MQKKIVSLVKTLFVTSVFLMFVGSIFSQTTVSYLVSNDDFANPERGFCRYTITYASNYSLLDSTTLANYRSLHQPYSANYSVYSTLVFRYFVLDIFKDCPISATFLQNLQTDFNTVRKAGVKLIIRFSYVNTPNTGDCGNWICPPFGDAPKNIVLQHIAQLKPYLTANADIIAAVQMGFIGVWGEQCYTDYFGDLSSPPYTLNETNWADRNEVLDSILSAVPVDLCVQVRCPQMKQKDIYGINAPTNSAALLLSEAFLGANKARIGFHNDCLLANYNDYGTYNDFSLGLADTLNLKPYKASDSKFVMVGGETCDSTGLWSLCDSQGGIAVHEMNRMHYSYLNADYNNVKVNNHWTNICMDEIKKRLGYRLYLLSGEFSNTVEQGNNLTYSINVINEGFSSPINKRNLKLILKNLSTNETWEANLDHDIRYWFQGSHNLTGQICIPSCMASGSYSMHLKLSDPSISLEDRPEYSIRLANTGLWDAATGYNNLNHIVSVSSASNSCTSSIEFSSVNKWIGPDNALWNASNSYWSQNRIPTSCDHVVIATNKTVKIPQGYVANVKKVSLIENSNLIILEGGELLVVE
jgi:hypothetical protein